MHVDPHIQALRRIDPLLQFLCKATGQVMVDWTLIKKSLPVISLSELQSLHEYGVLRVLNEQVDKNNEESHDPHDLEKGWKVGFPPPPLTTEATTSTTSTTTTPTPASTPLLHGCTKRAAQQRVSWLTKQLRQKQTAKTSELYTKKHTETPSSSSISPPPKNTTKQPVAVTPDAPMPATTTTPPQSPRACNSPQDAVDISADERQALKDIKEIFGWSDADGVPEGVGDEPASCETKTKSAVPTGILPRQISFAGSQAAQPAIYASLQTETLGVPDNVYRALVPVDKPLYRHQVEAITAALQHNKHVSLTTGTGSGKSLAFLFPVITTVVKYNRRAMLLFPTKALAQDQITKLQALADRLDQPKALRPATLDGDTPHSQRKAIAESANLILTNPDTLHAAILPNWEKGYTQFLAELAFVVVDEAHCYQGVFGAHVALILSRLRRLCAVARARNENDDRDFHAEASLRFIATSATLPWPEVHVRNICPIGEKEALEVIDQDTSPRAAKHFFVWNPPLLSAQGASSGSVVAPCRSKKKTSTLTNSGDDTTIESGSSPRKPSSDKESSLKIESSKRPGWRHREPEWHRRHAADETALLLVRAVIQGRRTIAFAKTRNLVEWIFERTLAALRSDPATAHLVGKVESYRGGYTRIERRKIEDRLFRNDLLGVVGTNALELGVDVGGIDLTLHCGYPSL